jgi:type IV pilus assembly protein PilO
MKFGFREIVFLAVMLGLLGASYFLVFSKADARRAEKQKRIDERTQALAELKRATDTVQDVDHKIAELQQATSFFESKLPQAQEMDKVLKEVSPLAERNNLQTRTVKTLKPQRMNGYTEQPIEMTLTGDFAGFYEFLLQLEKLPRLTRVTHMNLTKVAERDGEMQALITLSIFFEPDTGANAAATASAQP